MISDRNFRELYAWASRERALDASARLSPSPDEPPDAPRADAGDGMSVCEQHSTKPPELKVGDRVYISRRSGALEPRGECVVIGSPFYDAQYDDADVVPVVEMLDTGEHSSAPSPIDYYGDNVRVRYARIEDCTRMESAS